MTGHGDGWKKKKEEETRIGRGSQSDRPRVE